MLLLVVSGPAFSADPADIEQAIEEGLAWLVANYSAWDDYCVVGQVGHAVMKLADRAYELEEDPFDPSYVYHDEFMAGLNTLFSYADTVNIGLQTYGDPDTDGRGSHVSVQRDV